MSANITLPPLNTPRKTAQGWVIDLPADVLQIMGLEEGSIGLLHPRPGGLEVEILPPLSPDWSAALEEVYVAHQDAFTEMKRLGD